MMTCGKNGFLLNMPKAWKESQWKGFNCIYINRIMHTHVSFIYVFILLRGIIFSSAIWDVKFVWDYTSCAILHLWQVLALLFKTQTHQWLRTVVFFPLRFIWCCLFAFSLQIIVDTPNNYICNLSDCRGNLEIFTYALNK